MGENVSTIIVVGQSGEIIFVFGRKKKNNIFRNDCLLKTIMARVPLNKIRIMTIIVMTTETSPPYVEPSPKFVINFSYARLSLISRRRIT